MSSEGLYLADKREFDRVYEIMEEAFPPCELRDYVGQRALLDHPNYRLYVKKVDGVIVSFLGAWEFDDFIFGEHFAVDDSCRGNGLGATVLKEFFNLTDKVFFFEVESPESQMAARRIKFYERLGCQLSDFGYVQPALQSGQEPVDLICMTYPIKLDEETFESYKKQVFDVVYKN